MRVRTPVEAQVAARLILIHGRPWVDFRGRTALMEHGIRCIIGSPAYREELYREAHRRAVFAGKGLLAASLTDARDVLALNDPEEAE